MGQLEKSSPSSSSLRSFHSLGEELNEQFDELIDALRIGGLHFHEDIEETLHGLRPFSGDEGRQTSAEIGETRLLPRVFQGQNNVDDIDVGTEIEGVVQGQLNGRDERSALAVLHSRRRRFR